MQDYDQEDYQEYQVEEEQQVIEKTPSFDINEIMKALSKSVNGHLNQRSVSNQKMLKDVDLFLNEGIKKVF